MDRTVRIKRYVSCLDAIEGIYAREEAGFDEKWITGMLKYWITMLIKSINTIDIEYEVSQQLTKDDIIRFSDFYNKHRNESSFNDILMDMKKYNLVNSDFIVE